MAGIIEGFDYIRQYLYLIASVSGLATDEELGKGGTGELLTHQAGEEHYGTSWSVVHHEVLGLAGGIAVNRNYDAGRLAADPTRVLLDEAAVAVIAGEAESWSSYNFLAATTIVRTASAPFATPCIAAPSPVTSSAKLSSHHG
jgi:hypothetical protein